MHEVTSQWRNEDPADSSFSRLLAQLCQETQSLPAALLFTDIAPSSAPEPTRLGSSSDVFKGTLTTSRTDRKPTTRAQHVALKRLRIFPYPVAAPPPRYYGDFVRWNLLRHPHVLPFLGLTQQRQQELGAGCCIVTPWQKHGNVRAFLRDHPDPTEISRLLLEVARGLEYLHSEGLVHGDLRGANVLVHDDGRAQIADYGLRRWLDDAAMEELAGEGGIKNARWEPPEYMAPSSSADGEGGEVWTPAGDVYSFGLLCWELWAGKCPFWETKRSAAVILAVIKGKRPDRPSVQAGYVRDMPGALWDLVQKCWVRDPGARPTMNEVVRTMSAW
ncbi:kinase-like protein [Punctularia strigosozonata HHB-11173 SS5]|uniref:Kinase-like protein n=1 Tax=Punctularia strigosozonata (strain HHB-11173) TaxID=741275 RepID=R7S5N3_PUNST|nr:kinase-like protein [Punctularia strigosozonata HHB-11173 SS5]EIN04766.1 kinase-like protein [Punctularia strigosozonata HHB-11173 SS5]